MFTTIIVKPLFNALIFIYAILPGHNFGLALIIFTILFRFVIWPLVRKQLHQAKAMRKLQPELKKIKQQTKGDRQKEGQMIMELYKEKGINPVGTLPILILQIVILIGLNSGLRKIIANKHEVITFSYSWVRNLPWMKHLATNIHLFDNTLFGVVNLGKAAISSSGLYLPALIIVLLSAASQFLQSKQLLPVDKDSKGLRQIMKEASAGKQADQTEISGAVGRSTQYLLPVMIFLFTIELASALSLYWFVSGAVAYIQQAIALHGDETEMEKLADKPTLKDTSKIQEAAIVATKEHTPKPKKTNKKKKLKEEEVVNQSLEEAIVYAKKYLEDLLSFFGLNTDVHATSEDEVIQLGVPSTNLNGFLIGQRGENMRSMQYLTSTALKNQNFEHTRVNVDIADYKKQRAERLRDKAEEWVKDVRDSKETKELEPMNAADRRVIHKLASEYNVISESVGEGKDRHIVLKPATG